MKKLILYAEDNQSIRNLAERKIARELPAYSFVTMDKSGDVASRINDGSVSIDNLAIVCTDGQLLESSFGWDVVEELRKRGYSGPALYMGYLELPKDKENLYSGRCDKTGDDLISKIKGHLET